MKKKLERTDQTRTPHSLTHSTRAQSESQTLDWGKKVVKSKVVNNGGATPDWKGEVLKMDLVDHAELIMR